MYLPSDGCQLPENAWPVIYGGASGQFDFGLYKSIKLPREGMNLQFRSEFFNFFNHSNVFINPGTNLFTGADSSGAANKGVFPGGGKERRNIQLGLRLAF